MTKKNTRQKPWFIKVRGSYLPDTWQGWLTYVPYAAYVIGIFAYALANTPDYVHTIPIIVPNWIVALVVMTWVAEQKS